jgi:hypothetical protein
MNKDSRDESATLVAVLSNSGTLSGLFFVLIFIRGGGRASEKRRNKSASSPRVPPLFVCSRPLFSLPADSSEMLETHTQFMRMQFIHIAQRRVFLAAANKFPVASTFYTLMV